MAWIAAAPIFAVPPAVNTWKDLIEQPGLSPKQREGARFLSGFLEMKQYERLSPNQRKTLLRYAEDHRDGSPSIAICWRQDTPAEILEAFRAVEEAGAQVRRKSRRPAGIGMAFQADVGDHWNTTATGGAGQNAQGQPVTLTWSIVPDGTIIAGGEITGEATNKPSDLRARLAAIYGGSSTGPAENEIWFPIIQAVFDNIAAQTGIHYVYEPNDDKLKISNSYVGNGMLGTRGDIRISGHAIDGNSNVLAYNYFPDNADMVLDTTDNYFENLDNNSIRLRNVIEHEHGHGLGLGHVCPLDSTKLMEPYVNLNFIGIQFDEVYTLQRLYGDLLEVHGSESNNDTLATATTIAASLNVPFVAEWLGIDDNSDIDHFKFTAPAGSQLTVRVIPSSATYLEGGQNPNSGNCTAGTSFNAAILNDLSFQIIDSDQSTVLATASSAPPGTEEVLSNLPINRADTYYLRVYGGSADFNQLYRLEVEVNAASIALQIGSVALVKELLQGQNGALDPGETVELEIGIDNIGLLGGTNFNATLSLPPGSQGFQTTTSYGDLASGVSASRSFVFAPAGSCGEEIDLVLWVTADGGFSASLPLKLPLGLESDSIHEHFDTSTSLPNFWTSTSTGQGSGWSVIDVAVHSTPNSIFAANAYEAGSSTLTSPVIPIADSPGTLSFFQWHDTETNYDGGVLEIKIGNGNWEDILASGATFLSGGYSHLLNNSANPVSGRNAWSGNSNAIIETVVSLPASVINQDVRFRWIMGHDSTVGDTGWVLDDIQYRSFTCDESGAALVLSSGDTSCSELADPADTAEIRVSAILPVPSNYSVTLASSGSATVGEDLIGFGNLFLTTGNDEVALILSAVNDGEIEGPETLHVTSPDAAGSVDLTVNDTPYATWAAAELGIVAGNLPFEDFDGDGSLNVEELIYGTDGNSASSQPSSALIPHGNDFKLSVPLDTLPGGVRVDAETSIDLVTWTQDGIIVLEDGFILSGSTDMGFLRLLYSVPEFGP